MQRSLYAPTVFGNPTFKTFVNAMRNRWLSNYPDLTLQMLNANKPHTPATALGHITASRSGIRSSRRPTKKSRLSQASGPPIPQFLTQPSPLAQTNSSSDSSSSDSEPAPKRKLQIHHPKLPIASHTQLILTHYRARPRYTNTGKLIPLSD
jgi:hypothetical protein